MITLSEVPSNAINVANTVYVMKNGNDSTGLVQRFDKPFLTINAAINAADTYFTSRTNEDRIKIIVYNGIYDEEVTLKNFIDLDLNDCTLINDSGGNYSAIIKDNAQTFSKVSVNDVNVYITGNANLITYSTHTDIQYPLQLNGNGTFIITLNSIISNVGECVLCDGNPDKILKIYFNKFYCYNSTDFNLIQPIHILMNTSYDFQGKYEFIGGTIEARDTPNLKVTILATFPNTSVSINKYCDIILNNCLIIGNSNTMPTICTLGENSNEISGNIRLYLLSTRIWNKYSVDSISALGVGSNILLYNYNSYSNYNANINVSQQVNSLGVNSNITPI